jgi:hypothetical protein
MRRWLKVAVISASVLGGLSSTRATLLEEYEVKAAFIYNFSKFIEWPTQALPKEGEPFVIGLLGRNPFHDHLKNLQKECVQGHSIAVRSYETIEEVKGCHILFISQSEEKRINAIVKTLSGTQILTVSDMDGFLKNGGMICFRMNDQKVQFTINRSAMLSAGLKPSSELLKLAKELIP